MNKVFKLFLIVFVVLIALGFKPFEREENTTNLDNLYIYQKRYTSQDVGACALGQAKSYMDYRAVTDPTSPQYWFIKNNMEVDTSTGLLLDEDGFIGVALGSYYGVIGDRYYFTLDSGVVLPVVKIDEKADKDTDENGCYHLSDGSVIEFVIDSYYANEFFGYYNNGLVLQGNFANYHVFKGSIIKAEKVLDEERRDFVTYADVEDLIPDPSIFDYASGY